MTTVKLQWKFGLIIPAIIITILLPRSIQAQDLNIAERYAGSFLIETIGSSVQRLWYVHPQELVRYVVDDNNDFSRLLNNVGLGVDNATLAQLQGNSARDLIISHGTYFSGSIFLENNSIQKAWYFDPLQSKLHFVANGQIGFDSVYDLAHHISTDRLREIPETTQFGFTSTTSKPSAILLRTSEIDFDKYQNVWDTIKLHFFKVESLSNATMLNNSLKGLAAGTGDEYTAFWAPEEYAKEKKTIRGDLDIEGIGAVIEERDNYILILSVLVDSPALGAGLDENDLIMAVDGMSIRGFTVEQAVNVIAGPKGTSVVLTIKDGQTGRQRDVTVVRDKIDVPLINVKVLDGNVLYFKFHLFTTSVVSEFNELLDKYMTTSTKGLVIDMRNNPGGVTSGAIDLADMWLETDLPIVFEKRPEIEIEYISSPESRLTGMRTVILANENTASASEIFTRALQHYKRASVVGQKTFGKGTGQNIYQFEDGSALKLTTFEWLAADSESVDGRGVMPDILIENIPYSDFQFNRAYDLARYGR